MVLLVVLVDGDGKDDETLDEKGNCFEIWRKWGEPQKGCPVINQSSEKNSLIVQTI